MDFWGTVRVLARRWYVVLPALVLSVVLTLLTYSSIPTRYGSTGVVLLTSPSAGARFSELTSPDELVQVNPLLAFDGSLVISAQIIAQVLNDPATKRAIGAGPGSASTYLANNGETNGPILFVATESDSAAEAEALAARALERAKQELDNRQRELGAPPSTFITSQVLVAPTAAEAQIGGKIRFAGAAMVLSLLATLGATFAFDSLIEAMKRRRRLAGEPAPAPLPISRARGSATRQPGSGFRAAPKRSSGTGTS